MDEQRRRRNRLAELDGWMASNPWHPRVVPFFCWIIFLTVTTFLPEPWAPAQPVVYTLQCVATVWLLWRYRGLTPELTARFHWLAVPTGVFLLVAWVVLGYAMAGELPYRWGQLMQGHLGTHASGGGALGQYPYDALGVEPNRFGPSLNALDQPVPHESQSLIATHPALGYASLGLRLIGMALIVPFFEELFIRSAMLRGLHRPGRTVDGLLQFGSDLPVVGEYIGRSERGRRALAQPPAFTRQLSETDLGNVTLFATAASTVVFMLSHAPRDWPGCIACGVVWCWLVCVTNREAKSELGSGKSEVGEAGSPQPGTDEVAMRSHGDIASGSTPHAVRPTPHAPRSYGLGPVVWSHGITNALLWGYTLWWGDWRFL